MNLIYCLSFKKVNYFILLGTIKLKKTLVCIIIVLVVAVSCLELVGQVLAAPTLKPVHAKLTTEFGQKID